MLVAHCGDGTYTIYLVSSPTETKDYQGRKISIAVLVSSCAEEKAKGLVAWTLEHWDNFVDTFTSFVIDFEKDEWTANDDAIKDWVDQIQEIAKTKNAFEYRTHNGNTAENRHNLFAELHKFDCKPKSAFKLVVSDELMTGGKLETLKSEVDRYLSGEGTSEILLGYQTVSVEKTSFNQLSGCSTQRLQWQLCRQSFYLWH